MIKRICILLAALVLIFAVACSGDNPSPAETPAVNTSGATQSDIRRYADIASSLMTQMVPLDDELRTLFFQNAGREHVTISNEAGTFSFTGSVDSDGFPSGGVAKLDGYSFLVTEADGRTTRTTTWGEFTSAGKNGTYDFTIRLDDEGKTFEPSADPLLGYAKEALSGITLGYTGSLDQLNENESVSIGNYFYTTKAYRNASYTRPGQNQDRPFKMFVSSSPDPLSNNHSTFYLVHSMAQKGNTSDALRIPFSIQLASSDTENVGSQPFNGDDNQNSGKYLNGYYIFETTRQGENLNSMTWTDEGSINFVMGKVDKNNLVSGYYQANIYIHLYLDI